MRPHRFVFGTALVLLGPALTAAPAAAGAAPAARISVLSNRADLVSGGDALVAIDSNRRAIRVRLNGTDVTSAFHRVGRGRRTGLVSGLRAGPNDLVVWQGAGAASRLTITSHPRGGPVFSGAQVRPWRCQTVENGLGAATDEQCDAASIARDVVLSDGSRATLERGTLNRGIYDIVMPPRWTGKLAWAFGAGTGQLYRQGIARTPVADVTAPVTVASAQFDEALRRGYAVVASTMTDNSQHSNDVTAAETVMMVKEHIAERYGPIRFTVGLGGSGGALQQYLIADAYPGLLDGLLPTQDWPDQIVGAYREFADCAVLVRHMRSSTLWTDVADRVAVFGHGGPAVCDTSSGRAPDYMRPDDGTACAGDDSYDPRTNPAGVRCTLQDFTVAVYGVRPQGCAGAGVPCARRPWDNVGVQYGLAALRSGAITAEQFVDINEHAGGFDVNMVWTPERTRADLAAVVTAHRTGRVVFGRGLARVPILVLRGTDNNDYHYPWRSLVLRNRLDRANGQHANQVLWTNGSDGSTLAAMDRWLEAVTADRSGAPLERKVVRHRPPDVTDACWVAGVRVGDPRACDAAFPYRGDTRVAAGEGPTSDLLACRLRPVSRADYPRSLDDADWNRLRRVFRDGVCDYRRPGVGQTDPGTGRLAAPQPWVSFSAGPGGHPLGPPPTSARVR